MLISRKDDSFHMNQMSQAITGCANTHKESLNAARAAVITGNYSMAVEILDMTVKIMDEMIKGLAKI